MTYDHQITLISETIIEDELGNQRPTETRKDVLCRVQSVGRNEFYNAANNGMKPELVFVIHGYEYENESSVEYEGIKYKVIRTYSTGFEELELTCEKVIGNG